MKIITGVIPASINGDQELYIYLDLVELKLQIFMKMEK